STVLIDLEARGNKVYMTYFRKRQDYGFFIFVLKNIDFAYVIKETLVIYRIRQGSVSRNKFNAVLYMWKVYRDIEKLNVFKATYYFMFYAFNGVAKYSSKVK